MTVTQSEFELSSERFDRPPSRPGAKLIICATGRTGSWLLCRAMIHHGIGVPHEYFNAQHISILGPRFGIAALKDGRRLGSDAEARRRYIETLTSRRVANGIFAAKIHWGQYADYLDNPEGAELFRDAHVIHLYREDLLAQAISFHVSKETGRWGLDDTVITPPAASPRFFDAELIGAHMRNLAEADTNWRLFFGRHGLSPLSVSYERLRSDPAAVLRSIVDRFELSLPADRLDYVEQGPSKARDAQVPPRSEIRARFLQAQRDATAASARPAPAPQSGRPAFEAQPPAAKSTAVHGTARTTSNPRAQPGMKTIGLCMIVKNEAKVIRQCLASTLPLLDYVLIVDTGSEDGTQQVIRDFLAEHDLPGVVIEEPWRNFAYNRNFALEKLREREDVDYALVMDADDALVLDPGFDATAFKKSLRHDFYDVRIVHGNISHHRPHLLGNRHPFAYKGVLHEYIEAPPGELSRTTAKGFSIHANVSNEGGRSQNPRKYQDDAALLERALASEADPFLISRYRFYLAQSYRDCGEKQKAVENYLLRAGLGYWDEEIFVSLYQAAKLQEQLGEPVDTVLATLARASDACPRRAAEALHEASRVCRVNDRFAEGHEFAARGLKVRVPEGGLFIESWIYEYGLLDELAVSAYWIGRYEDCVAACERLLRDGKIPESYRERVERNAQFAREKLASQEENAAKQPENAARETVPHDTALTHTASAAPRVLLAILAKQKEQVLPFYLLCIEALDYPKDSIVLHVRTNNNTDRTAQILKDWIARIGGDYAGVEFDDTDVPESVERFSVHEWNDTRFKVLARLRRESMQSALQNRCDYYFVVDVDNFVRPDTLKELISARLPIVAPLLRHVDQQRVYSNFHEKIDDTGYFADSEEYYWLLHRRIKGLCQVPVVHCTYLVRSELIPQLSYEDGSGRHEYVIFSESARRQRIAQYLDTREVYGYLTMDEDPREAMKLLGPQIGARLLAAAKPEKPRIFFNCCMHGSGSTSTFNLVREICRRQGIDFVSCHRESDTNLPWDALGTRLMVVKSQNPMPGLRDLIATCDEPAVMTVRDPRDAVVSFMQRFPNSVAPTFEEALNAIARSAAGLVALAKQRSMPVLRYEDGFVGSEQTFDLVAALLQTSPPESERRAILAELAPEAVKKKISELEAAGSIRGEGVWDPDTQWHLNHVGDGKVGKFARALSAQQQQEVVERTREFCERFGYSVTADAAAS